MKCTDTPDWQTGKWSSSPIGRRLEDQLSQTSQSIGFTVNTANNIRELKELLRADTSDLVMAMIHKFREADLTETFPQLNVSPNILVMTDEAHRSPIQDARGEFG